jgi:hypothetical protein
MNVAQFVQLVHGCKHFADIELGMSFFENTRVIQSGTEVAARDIFHGQVNIFRILKGIEKSDEPWCFSRSQNVSFYENMTDLTLTSSSVFRRQRRRAVTSFILNRVRFLNFFNAQTSPVSSLLARKTSPYPP